MLWLLVLGALVLLALLVFGFVRACGTAGSDDEDAGSQGDDTTQEEQASSGEPPGRAKQPERKAAPGSGKSQPRPKLPELKERGLQHSFKTLRATR